MDIAITWMLINVWAPVRRTAVRFLGEDRGQTVAEYALVLLVVAAIAGGFLVWAKSTGKLDQFFDSIFDQLVDQVTPTPTP